MLLVGTYLSPFARRVAAALVSRGIAFEHEDLNGYADPARARELNPVGKVPVLRLDDGESLFDSAAILDHVNESLPAAQALVPPFGRGRREVLRLAAIATTLYERCTACYVEAQRPREAQRPQLIEQQHLAIVGGLRALDAASARGAAIGTRPFNLATLSAVVAHDYAAVATPDLKVAEIAPGLAKVAAALREDTAFARTRPQIGGGR